MVKSFQDLQVGDNLENKICILESISEEIDGPMGPYKKLTLSDPSGTITVLLGINKTNGLGQGMTVQVSLEVKQGSERFPLKFSNVVIEKFNGFSESQTTTSDENVEKTSTSQPKSESNGEIEWMELDKSWKKNGNKKEIKNILMLGVVRPKKEKNDAGYPEIKAKSLIIGIKNGYKDKGLYITLTSKNIRLLSELDRNLITEEATLHLKS
ncbi:MAG: hypothetical protein EAX96_06510 [Candidatus Lokiarchaeota archaeon]|nr:hypothetical protein [Candidatus Lokiarchaeota archaeon]